MEHPAPGRAVSRQVLDTVERCLDLYLLGAQDDRPYEADLKGYGRVFPHPFEDASNKLFYTKLLVSPVGDQLTET